MQYGFNLTSLATQFERRPVLTFLLIPDYFHQIKGLIFFDIWWLSHANC
uniref:Uncharacterized protein n=1 Tax=Anguilla anguilla TaxID=7936 RepID=A0A0E9S2Z9_ANGAN